MAGRGAYLLSFLPESDVNRIIEYAAGTGKRAILALEIVDAISGLDLAPGMGGDDF